MPVGRSTSRGTPLALRPQAPRAVHCGGGPSPAPWPQSAPRVGATLGAGDPCDGGNSHRHIPCVQPSLASRLCATSSDTAFEGNGTGTGGGGGSGVYVVMCVWGAMSLWTWPPWPCACAHGPQKSTQQLSRTMSCNLVDEMQLRRPPQLSSTPVPRTLRGLSTQRIAQRDATVGNDCLLHAGTCGTRKTCTTRTPTTLYKKNWGIGITMICWAVWNGKTPQRPDRNVDDLAESTPRNCHTGHDAEHLGRDDTNRQHSARCIVTSKTNQTDELLVHTGHDAEHLSVTTTNEHTGHGLRKLTQNCIEEPSIALEYDA